MDFWREKLYKDSFSELQYFINISIISMKHLFEKLKPDAPCPFIWNVMNNHPIVLILNPSRPFHSAWFQDILCE